MLSDAELLIKSEIYALDENNTPISKVISGIVMNAKEHVGRLSKFQHTFLCQFCISHEWAEEEYRRMNENAIRYTRKTSGKNRS